MGRSAPSKKMLVKSEDEIAKVLAEAEQIKAGENPATITSEASGSSPATSADAQGGAVETPAAAPSPSLDQIAELLCLLCDWPFVRAFGAVGQLPEPFRSEARKAWAQVLETYMPAIVAKAGPFAVLVSVYSMHGAGLYLACQINAPVSASSEKEAPVSQP